MTKMQSLMRHGNGLRKLLRAGDIAMLSHGALLVGYFLLLHFRWGGEAYFTLACDLAIIPLSFGAFASSWAVSRTPEFDDRSRTAWRCFALAYFLYAAGDTIWFVFEIVFEIPPYPSFADVLYFAFYPAMIAALLLFSDKLESRAEKVTFGLDAGTTMIAGAMYVWHFLVLPSLQVADAGPLLTAVSVAYPVCDLVLMFGVIALSMRRSGHRGSWLAYLLLATALTFFCADAAFVYQNATGTYESGSMSDALYAASYFLAVVCGRVASRSASPAEPRAPRPRSFSVVPYVAVALAYGLLVGVPNERRELLMYGAIVLTGLVVVRQIVAAREVTRAQAALRASDERFQLVARATSDAVWDWNLVTDAVWWGAGVRELFGYEPDDITPSGAWWLAQLDPNDRDRVDRAVQAAIAGPDETIRLEYRFRRADGSYAPVVDRGFIVRDERGRSVRMVGTMMDITERERAERAMAEARDAALESARLKSQFLANMSHEIRTPMNGVIGMTDLVLDSDLSPDQREQLRVVKSSADSLLAIINDILDFSKIEAGKLSITPADFAVRDLVGDLLRPFGLRAREKHIALTCQVAADVPVVVRGDAGRVRQVLTNLVGNAVKFTERGTVALRVTREREEEDGASVLQFAVSDTGIGIAPDKRDVIFDPFTQADGSLTRTFGGTGLGLAISTQLVELMGGEISVESELGAGSTFRFTVRCDRATRETAAEPTAVGGAATRDGLRVLLAEDIRVNRLVATGLLERLGHEVIAVENGRLAVATFERGGIDVVLMDVQMPELDGFEAAAAIRRLETASGRRTPIVALTAHALAGDRERCLEAGMDDYVAKPLKAETLLAAIDRVMGREASL